ncbi:hypothetical protein [Stenotrophomonas bentonitica]|uniref:hypothetical protein n=1 Tax=Stenotrophomonas bentonitica TaxID=1450134 RepID=UPI0031BADCD2
MSNNVSCKRGRLTLFHWDEEGAPDVTDSTQEQAGSGGVLKHKVTSEWLIPFVREHLKLNQEPVTGDQVAGLVRALHENDAGFYKASDYMELAGVLLQELVRHDRTQRQREGWDWSVYSYEQVVGMIERGVLLAGIPEVSTPFLHKHVHRREPTKEEALFALIKRAVREVLAESKA